MSTISTPPVRPFLDLPSEIRNWIYGYCTPVNGYAEDYKGLSLSCKQIHSEYQGATLKVMERLLEGLKQNWRYEVRLRLPHSRLAEVVLELPASVYHQGKSGHYGSQGPVGSLNPYLEPAIASIWLLYLSKLTITFYKDEPASTRGYIPCLTACSIINDVDALLYGGASVHQVSFSKGYHKEPAAQSAPIHTKRLVVHWLTDLFEPESNATHCRHISLCHVIRSFKEKNVVRSWISDPKGSVSFGLNASSET
ncbi:hypothetical protein BKA66DRAFT_255277 [Pyrenochaeta sp. MPI-SDFR-AT-0127]|nr:hypothetical protein BKA66DRAFT_255277 [Pyrenochaeta sp. MPI-SDFR-AT-0127]